MGRKQPARLKLWLDLEESMRDLDRRMKEMGL
jgi:hypothetical protein